MRQHIVRALTFTFVTLLVLGAAPSARAGGEAPGPQAADLEKLKSLAGEWEGKPGSNPGTRATYEIVSNGTAVVETLSEGDETMVTVYHADGDRLAMTHYCGTGNQPRMRSEKPAAGETLKFTFLDVTNLASPEAGHMRSLAIRIEESDQITQTWTWREKGSEQQKVIELVRKR